MAFTRLGSFEALWRGPPTFEREADSRFTGSRVSARDTLQAKGVVVGALLKYDHSCLKIPPLSRTQSLAHNGA
jgi:hypothetical protein